MLQSISANRIAFKTDTTRDSKTGEYKDPLMRMPVRAMAFTNEVGEALRPLIGDYATISWVPALLYIGADIYDKYKNDKTEYSPDSHRFFKQAIFQGVASILLPLVAVKGGQNIFSLFGLLSKEKLTISAKEHIQNIAQEFIKNGNLHAYAKDDKACVEKFMNVVHSNLSFKSETKLSDLPFYKYLQAILDKMKVNKKSNLDKYSESLIKEVIQERKQILNPTNDFKSQPIYVKYEKALSVGQSKNVAIKTVLIDKIKNSSITGKVIKSIGGFSMIALLIKPIDNFVENTIIGKVIEPRLDKINNK